MHCKSSVFLLFIIILSFSRLHAAALPAHPRIIFTPEAEKLLEEKLKSDPYVQALHKSVLAAADRMLPLPAVERVQTGRRILSVSREALERIIHFSYAYRLTGNRQYLMRAEEEMNAAAAFSDWNPSHFLDVAEMTAALAIGYDWLHAHISNETKETVKKAIIEKGLQPSLIHDEWARARHNWNQVCNGGMVLGALAVYEFEPKLADEILMRADTSLLLPMEDYGPDGAYPEGPGYWGYGTSYHAIAIDASRTALGKENAFEYSPQFLASAWYKLHMHGPAGYFNYADNGYRNSLNPVMCWFASETNNPEVLWNQKSFFDAMKDASAVFTNRFTPLMAIWASRLTSLVFLQPNDHVWYGKGISPVAVMRSSWDEDAIFIGIKGGSPSSNHGHMDAGTFVMDAGGERWAFDLGGHPYHTLESRGLDIWNKNQDSERWHIMRYTNLFHNTLTVNMALQKVDSYSPLMEVSQYRDTMLATIDLSPAYAGYLSAAVRTVSIVNHEYVRVTDKVENGNAQATVQWNMITADSIQLSDAHNAIIYQNGKSLHVVIEEPARAAWMISSTKPENTFEDPNPGTARLGFEIDLATKKKNTLSVILKPGAKAKRFNSNNQ